MGMEILSVRWCSGKINNKGVKMSYLHKYDADGKTLYFVADKASKPSGTFSVKQDYWRGRAVGGNSARVLSQLATLKFTVAEEESEEPKKKSAPRIKRGVSEIIKTFVSSISKE